MTSNVPLMHYSWSGYIYPLNTPYVNRAFSITYIHESEDKAREALMTLLEKAQSIVYPLQPKGQPEMDFRNECMSNALNAEIKFWSQDCLEGIGIWEWNNLASDVKQDTIVSHFWKRDEKMTLKDYIMNTSAELTPVPEVYTLRPASVCLWFYLSYE